jgi:perosamine synthetase
MDTTTTAVPPFRYWFPDNEIERITAEFDRLLRTGAHLTNGANVADFERAFALYADVDSAVAVATGSAALQAVLEGLDVIGRDVIVPTNTFAATVFAVLNAGAIPVFADAAADFSLSPDAVAALIGPDTAAVITVHVGGIISPSVRQLVELCDQHDVALIEDAAHAHGSRLDGAHAGTFGMAAALSFFSTKVMTTGEGGMVLTNDPNVTRTARLVRDQAKVAGANRHDRLGHSWRMTELTALLGLSQLRILNTNVTRRQAIAGIYDTALADLDAIQIVQPGPGSEPNGYKYLLLADNGADRDRIVTELRARAVTPAGFVYDLPCHRQPVFARWATGSYPVAEDLAARHFALPIYPTMTEPEIDQVIAAVTEVCS